MRTNKYRAWDGSKYHYYTSLSGLYGVLNPIEEQFTGLTDKNGKEIYEGDILKAKRGEQSKYNHYEIKDTVRFSFGGFKCFDKNFQDFYVETPSMKIKNMMWCWHGSHYTRSIYEEIIEVEIIGNIHENPELLNQ